MMKSIKRILPYVFILAISISIVSNSPLNTSLVQFWARQIGHRLKTISEECTGIEHIRKGYNKLDLKIKKVGGEEMVLELSKKIEQYLSGKVEALRDLSVKAINAEQEFVDDHEELVYHNGRHKFLNISLNLTSDAHFGVPVTFNSSIVHVPTEVYDRGPKVARDIKWTKSLEEVFRQNLKNHPDLSWQYFGTAEGIHRQFPGREWPAPTGNRPDMYDARRRPGYIQGASSAKDVILLIDRSGSTLGLRIDIIKFSATVLIDTLTTNDFFHVIVFNNESTFLCCGAPENGEGYSMLQATRRNREFVKTKLETIKPDEVANWSLGTEMALNLLNTTKNNKEGTRCQQVLIILTDGSATYEKELFQKYDPNNTIRVFAFVVGPRQYDVKAMKQMAANHKGYYLRIASLGVVWETVASFIRVLSRPVGLAPIKPVTFTSVFVDATGTGLVSTVSLPVFKNGTSRLLGVMATDVPVKDLSEFINFPLIGHNGYVFAIDNNGLILIHPAIDSDKLSQLIPQPNMNIDELEFAVHNHSLVLQMRKEMIMEEMGNMTFEAHVKSRDELRVRRDVMQYHYIRSEKNAFSVGVVSPEYGFEILNPEKYYEEGRRALQNVTRVKNWPYCLKIRLQKDIKTALLEKLPEDAKHMENDTCEMRMIYGLLVDAIATEAVEEVWRTQRSNITGHAVKNVHVTTHWGAIRSLNGFSPYSEEQLNKTELPDLTLQSGGIYGRSVKNGDKLTITVPLKKTGTTTHYPDYVSIHNPVRLEKQNITVAVTGVEMKFSDFGLIISEETKKCENGKKECEDQINRIACDRATQHQFEGVYCYILDENAFIISSTIAGEAGMFFGSIDVSIMLKLLEKNKPHSLYDEIVLPDHQAWCFLNTNDKSSGNIINSMLQSITILLKTIIQTIIILWWNIQNVGAGPAPKKDDCPKVTCMENTTIYLANNKIDVAFRGNATCCEFARCADCIRDFIVSSIPGTNLYMLVAESNCGKCDKHNRENYNLLGIPGRRNPRTFHGTNYIKKRDKEKIRRKPSTCFCPKYEDNSRYGRSHTTQPSTNILLLTLLILLLLRTTHF